MSASFAGITIAERGTGATFPAWDAKQITTVQPRPSGDAPVIRDHGADVMRLAFVAKVTAANLALLYAARQTSGSLVMGYETHNAFLDSITGVSEQLAGKDVYFATLNFIRL